MIVEQTDEVQIERIGGVGILTLNRPKALNALSLAMVRAMDELLQAWAADPKVQAVVVRGNERAFCAGGDVRAVYEDGRAARAGAGGALTAAFFRDEYRLNRRIRRYPKPYVALIDGITMGGGIGISVHGSHRVATDRTVCAMPETAIGFFPDVGGTYVLGRCPGETGVFAGLTGARLKAADAVYLDIATHVVGHQDLERIVADLASAKWEDDGRAVVDRILAKYAVDPGPAPLAARRDLIDRCFGRETVEEIWWALSEEQDPWAEEQLAVLQRMSPTSLKVALRAIREARDLAFEQALTVEYRLSQSLLRGHDFYEGIRAVLVDKDHKPKWRPASLESVTPSAVEAAFAPLNERDLVFQDA